MAVATQNTTNHRATQPLSSSASTPLRGRPHSLGGDAHDPSTGQNDSRQRPAVNAAGVQTGCERLFLKPSLGVVPKINVRRPRPSLCPRDTCRPTNEQAAREDTWEEGRCYRRGRNFIPEWEDCCIAEFTPPGGNQEPGGLLIPQGGGKPFTCYTHQSSESRPKTKSRLIRCTQTTRATGHSCRKSRDIPWVGRVRGS